MPDAKELMVNPGKNNPGEKTKQPRTSAIAATIPLKIGPNNMENIAIGKKLRLIRINGVWIAKTLVNIMIIDTKIAEIIRVVVVRKGWVG
jgi:hypothetical protein